MSKKIPARMLLALLAALACASARADFVFRMGDSVHVNGKVYTQEEWDRIKNDPKARAEAEGKAAPAQPAAAPAAAPAVATTAPASAPARIAGPRAATCRTTRMLEEFPDEGEKFSCSGGLGSLSREEILEAGWKVDLIEKLPAPAGAPATSSRGLPLSSYKLILSR